MSFADTTRTRFSQEVRGGKPNVEGRSASRSELLRSYEDWWFGKRRDFLIAMRDYLRKRGIPDARVLYTAEGSESGTSFATWEKRVVTDDLATWQRIAASILTHYRW